MNGARSTFTRMGYLLTALAAAVLAASPGTAYAQSVGFVGTSSTMMEGASPDAKTPAPITIDINVSGLTAPSDGENGENGETGDLTTGLGTLTFEHDADEADNLGPGEDARTGDKRRIWLDSKSSAIDADGLSNGFTRHGDADKMHLYGVADMAVIPYDSNGVIKLVIIDPGGDGNWQDNKFTINIESTELGISPNPGSYSVTVVDTSVQPTAKFSKTNVVLTKETVTTVPVAITVGVGMDDTAPAGLASLMNMIKFTTSPAGAVVTGTCGEGDILSIEPAGFSADGDDTWTFTARPGSIDAVTIGIEACGNMTRFNDEMVTFSFDADSLKGVPVGYGNVAAGADLVVTVRSEGEDTPTVTFSAARRQLDEGGTDTVAILASGKLAGEVGSVMVSVSGDAVLSLWQAGDMLDAGDDGMYTVDLDGGANTILTIMADDDPALDDGMTATATITIESANGADIGAPNSLAVTVSGVTQETDPDEGDEDSEPVPALPLIAQWLLGLGLMGGGARQLFRRRRQGS